MYIIHTHTTYNIPIHSDHKHTQDKLMEEHPSSVPILSIPILSLVVNNLSSLIQNGDVYILFEGGFLCVQSQYCLDVKLLSCTIMANNEAEPGQLGT